MPSKWIASRSIPVNTGEASAMDEQQNFDFALSPPRPLPHPQPSHLPDTDSPTLPIFDIVDHVRPTTSAGAVEVQVTEKLRPDISPSRPLTSDSHTTQAIDPKTIIPKSEDDLIGVAFGSPGHPPMAFRGISRSATPIEADQALGQQKYFGEKPTHLQLKRLKKFGALFGSTHSHPSRKDSLENSHARPQIEDELDFNINALTSKHQWFKSKGLNAKQPVKALPKSPDVSDMASDMREDPHLSSSQEPASGLTLNPIKVTAPTTSTNQDRHRVDQTADTRILPKLEIDIPNAPLDRYSVMFRNVRDPRVSTLLERRSKVLDSLRESRNDVVNNPLPGRNESPEPPLPPRRMTTPTGTRSPASYSLFPVTSAAPVKIIGRVPFSDSPLKRCATSPARLSPMQDYFPLVRPQPLNTKRNASGENLLSSPEQVTASTDRDLPWSSTHSIQSSVSSATTMEEIFFDIKMCRDSKGLEDGQFVMTRPDSAAVKLVRTKSKLAAASRRVAENVPESVEELNDRHSSVNTAVFDEVIAAVERFARPASPVKATAAVPPVSTKINQSAIPNSNKLSPLPELTVTDPENDTLSPEEPTSGKSKKGIEFDSGSRVDPPSRSATPLSIASTANMTKPISSRLLNVRKDDRPIEESPTIPQGPPSPRRPLKAPTDTPPPVPEKDAKFVPISKYANKSTMKAVERIGARPLLAYRAATDTLLIPKQVTGRLTPEKLRPTTSAQRTEKEVSTDFATKSIQHGAKKSDLLTTPAPVRPAPATEVSVARTVSLSRKQSARVHVPGPKLVALKSSQANASNTAEKSRQESSWKEITKDSFSRLKDRKKDLTKWEFLEKRAMSPVLVEPQRGHKPGTSMSLVVETS